MIRKSVFFFAFALLAGSILGAQRGESNTFSGVTEIRLQTVSGGCQIERSTSSDVIVEVDSSFDERSYYADMEQRGDRLILKERFSGRSNSGNSKWTLFVPDDVRIEFSTASGDFEMTGVRADIEVSTASGEIRLTDVAGDLEASTASGNVIGRGLQGILHLSTASGDVQVEDSMGEFKLSTASGDVRARNLSFDSEGSFSSASGNAELTLASSPQFDLKVSSASGDAILEINGVDLRASLEVMARKDRNIRAPFSFDREETIYRWDQEYVRKSVDLGGGGPLIEVSTASGRAEIRR